MTIADLIAELQRLPQHLPVRVLMSSIITITEFGEDEIRPSDAEAIPATEVKYEGGHVTVIG